MTEIRAKICEKLHRKYAVQAFDNQDVWAGNLSIVLDGLRFEPVMARAFLQPEGPCPQARVRVELYLRDIDPAEVGPGDLDARVWTDVNDRGFQDARGVRHSGLGAHLPLHLIVDARGRPRLSGNNLAFESDLFEIHQTGVYHYTAEFSADGLTRSDPGKAWITINDITLNRDGLIVITPEAVRRCPSVMEVCVRKVGAAIKEGRFRSGAFREVEERLEGIPADIIHLLPFFEPGYLDRDTGLDVRKGELGSVYAVRDFFRIDPRLVTPPEEADIPGLCADGLIRDLDLQDLLDGRHAARLARVEDFRHFPTRQALLEWVGRDAMTQIVGRAELRRLARRAHGIGKRVIFDLVLMQTSRDCPLVERHPEWYVLDESGRPRIHQIAWLVYSDVALLDLPFNRPLQNFLSSVAPFWIQTCDLDGVRIDASQTVDRPFLKEIKNRINQVKPDAVVLGETLCPTHEAVDIPTDMIYALLVDFHRDATHARPYIDFLEQTFGAFARRTVAMAYFENHDSPRATRVWRDRFSKRLADGASPSDAWLLRSGGEDPALVMALMRNLQATLIDATAGTSLYVNLAYGLEFGTSWGEEEPTDFENPTLYGFEGSKSRARSCLTRAYQSLHRQRPGWTEVLTGHIYFHRNEFEGGDPEDRVLTYTRHTPRSAMLVAHNLDPFTSRQVTCRMDGMSWAGLNPEVVFDTRAFFTEGKSGEQVIHLGERIQVSLDPLQSLLIHLRPSDSTDETPTSR